MQTSAMAVMRMARGETAMRRIRRSIEVSVGGPTGEKVPHRRKASSLCRCAKADVREKNGTTEKATASRGKAEIPVETSKASLQSSEIASQKAVEATDFSLTKVTEVLRMLQVPPNTTRKNVMPIGQTYIQGMLFGLYSYGGSVGLASKTNKHPWLTKLLIGAFRSVAPDFPFTSIQLNYNYASRAHADANNLGTSFIVGLGDYTGGELWVHDESGDVEYDIQGDEDVTAFYHVGKKVNGKLCKIKDTWTMFDGNVLHYTLPFKGERYSIIYFTSDHYAATPEEAKAGMIKAGFDFDFNAADMDAVLRQKYHRRAEIHKQVAAEKAQEARNRLLSRGRCIGRVWAGAWGLRCTSVCEQNSDFCGSHIQRNRWKTHGRMDGDLPAAKRDEMAFYQQKLVADGKKPPVREGATILVPIPGWPETEHLKEVMQTYGKFTSKRAKQ